MGDDRLQLALVITGSSSGAKAAFNDLSSTSSRAVNKIRSEMNSLRSAWSGVMGKVAGLGLGLGAAKLVHDSAVLTKQLNLIGVAAGKSVADVNALRDRIEKLTVDSGGDAGQLAAAFDLVRKRTGSWDIVAASIDAINTSMTATGANAETLSGAMSAASKSFGIDFTKNGAALDFFNQLSTAGQGAGGLENVAGVFEHMAARAQVAGLSARSTMQLINAMGQVQSDPQQAGIMAETTLRLFSNLKQLSNKKSAGLRNILFDPSGAKRDAVDIMKTIQTTYNKLGDESAGGSRKKQDFFLARLTGGMDARSLMGMQMLLQKADFNKMATAGPDDLRAKMQGATNDMLSQVGRLRNALSQAADPFILTLNNGISKAIKLSMKNMSGGEIAGVGIGALMALYLGKTALKGQIGGLLGKGFSTGAGIAEGKLLQQAAGITPVFVVNWPGQAIGMPGAGLPGAGGLPMILRGGGVAAAAGMGIAAPLTAGLLVTGIGYALYKESERQKKGAREEMLARDVEQKKKREDNDRINGVFLDILNGRSLVPQVHVAVNVDKDGKSTVQSNTPGTRTDVNVKNRGMFYRDEKTGLPTMNWNFK